MPEPRQLLAQSIFPRLECNRYLSSPDYRKETDDLVSGASVGGFVLFEGDAEEVLQTTRRLQELANGSLLFAADCEDGVTMRFPGGTEFPSMMALGVANDVAATYSVARGISREMRALGIGWNFAPVVDVNTNPDNPIINIRSFGSSPELVSDHAHAYIQGMQDGGVAACAKHFPGHGDTSVDSHRDLPVLDFDERRLNTVELYPFREAVRQRVKSIMASHVAVPTLDPEGLPASVSKAMIGDLLRKKIGYKGIVVTDALDMDAITKRYSCGEASLMAYVAGVDVVLMPKCPAEALDTLVTAAKKGTLMARRIKESYNRITALKKWVASYSDDVSQPFEQARRGHDVIALEAARRSLTVTGRMRTVDEPVFVLAFVDVADNPKPDEWLRYLGGWRSGEMSAAIVTPDIDEAKMASILSAVDAAGSIIAAFFVKPRGYAGTVGLSPDQATIAVRAFARPTVMMNFGNPYLLRDANPAVRIDAYSASSPSLAASIEALSRTTM